MQKKALITGVRGQDGAYLAELLLAEGYTVYGAIRRTSDSIHWRLKELNIHDRVKYVAMDLLELTNIMSVLKKIQPDEIYNLGAQSFVSVSFDQPLLTSDIDGMGTLRLLEAVRHCSPHSKFYQASTSEMFGKVRAVPQTEETPFHPRSPYGFAKVFAHYATVNYRESYNMFTCSGILFNHESPLRGVEFVTRKISATVAKIKHGMTDKLVIGNLDAQRDWGYAKEYVVGMWKMMQLDSPDDFLLGTGIMRSVREFVTLSFAAVGYDIKWEGSGLNEKGINKKNGQVLVEVSPDFYRLAEVDILIGDASKAASVLGWRPTTKLEEIVRLMVEADLHRISTDVLV